MTRKSSTRKPPTNPLRAFTTLERRMSATNSRPPSGTVTPNIAMRDGEEIPDGEKRTLAALLGVQSQQEELVREMRQEMLDLEKKYLEKSAPLYERRKEIVSGAATPHDSELDAGLRAHTGTRRDSSAYTDLVTAVAKAAISSTPAARIADFWLTAFRNHRALRLLITERDAQALKSLVDVKLTFLTGTGGFTEFLDEEKARKEGELGYKLSFVFEPNEFFKNEVLEKTYVYERQLDWTGKTVVDHAEGTHIKWKNEGVNLTKSGAVLGQLASRTAKREVDETSFFKFFDPPRRIPVDAEEVSDEDIEENEFEFMLDVQLGEDFKDRIVPRAVDYFSGKSLEWEDHPDDWSDDETDYEDY